MTTKNSIAIASSDELYRYASIPNDIWWSVNLVAIDHDPTWAQNFSWYPRVAEEA